MQTQVRTFLLNVYGDHTEEMFMAIMLKSKELLHENLEVNLKSVQSSKFEIHCQCMPCMHIQCVINLKRFVI